MNKNDPTTNRNKSYITQQHKFQNCQSVSIWLIKKVLAFENVKDMVGVGADEFWSERDEQNRSDEDDRDNESWNVLPSFDAKDL